MSDQPKLHAYAVACAFGTPEATDPPARLMISVWIAYAPQEAAAMAMDQTHRAIAAQGQKLAPHAGTTTFEITEDHLSHMLNALRTGGKGATVLQAVAKEPPPHQMIPQEGASTNPFPVPEHAHCDHAFVRSTDYGNSGWFCRKCGLKSLDYQREPYQGDPA